MNSESNPVMTSGVVVVVEVVDVVDGDVALVVDADGSESLPHAARTSAPARARAVPLMRVMGAPDHGRIQPIAMLPHEHYDKSTLQRTTGSTYAMRPPL
jgi:hypothetical protein